MKPIDTHAHLQFEKFDNDRETIIQRNSERLLAVVNPGADIDTSEKAVKLSQTTPNFYAAVGVHPHHVDNWNNSYLARLEDLVQKKKVVAVGEIGLDKHHYQGYPNPDIKKQTAILLPQIELAHKYNKPILFHCRDAYDELYKVLKPYQPLVGLLHCFMGYKQIAKRFVDLGLLISFAGNLTFKGNVHMQKAAQSLAATKILIETESPYLTPEPLRGQRNEPVNVELVAAKIAELRGINKEEVVSFTSINAKKLFGI